MSFFQIVSKCFFVISVVFCLLFPNSSILSYTYLHSLLFLFIICFPFPLLISDSKFFLSFFISLAFYQRTCSKKWQALTVENFDSPRPGSGPAPAPGQRCHFSGTGCRCKAVNRQFLALLMRYQLSYPESFTFLGRLLNNLGALYLKLLVPISLFILGSFSL